MCPAARALRNIGPRTRTTMNAGTREALLALYSSPIVFQTKKSVPPSSHRRVAGTRRHTEPISHGPERPKALLSPCPWHTYRLEADFYDKIVYYLHERFLTINSATQNVIDRWRHLASVA